MYRVGELLIGLPFIAVPQLIHTLTVLRLELTNYICNLLQQSAKACTENYIERTCKAKLMRSRHCHMTGMQLLTDSIHRSFAPPLGIGYACPINALTVHTTNTFAEYCPYIP